MKIVDKDTMELDLSVGNNVLLELPLVLQECVSVLRMDLTTI